MMEGYSIVEDPWLGVQSRQVILSVRMPARLELHSQRLRFYGTPTILYSLQKVLCYRQQPVQK